MQGLFGNFRGYLLCARCSLPAMAPTQAPGCFAMRPWTVEVAIAAEADTKIVEIPRLGKQAAPVVASTGSRRDPIPPGVAADVVGVFAHTE